MKYMKIQNHKIYYQLILVEFIDGKLFLAILNKFIFFLLELSLNFSIYKFVTIFFLPNIF